MTPIIIDLGGHAIKIENDQFADGTPCVVAEHPDLDGCVVYAKDAAAALKALAEARTAYLESVAQHEGRSSMKGSTGHLCAAHNNR